MIMEKEEYHELNLLISCKFLIVIAAPNSNTLQRNVRGKLSVLIKYYQKIKIF